MLFTKTSSGIACLLCAIISSGFVIANETIDGNRPYEFSFNIVDFQHRYERKDADGIITGEYGFVTADGVYHETGYATDKNGDFIITRMRNRRITSLKDAQAIFKDRPEAARKLAEAVTRACSACKIAIKPNETSNAAEIATTTVSSAPRSKLDSILKEMTKILVESRKPVEPIPKHADKATLEKELPRGRNDIPRNTKDLSNERRGKSLAEGIVRDMVESAKRFMRKEEQEDTDANFRNAIVDDQLLEKMANDLYYRFNYTITSHEHQEDGYRSGKKDGSYRAQSENGVDTRVKYLSNEFGHQPNVSFVPRDAANESQRLKGYSFLWYWS